jgi:hypothetical protein
MLYLPKHEELLRTDLRIAENSLINGGAIIDHEAPDKRRFVAVPK